MYDVIIVGGGPAGLSAALILGRCRRRVLVCDSGRYRNESSRALHGFLSRDGVAPGEFLRIGREQLAPYGIAFCAATVTAATGSDGAFQVVLEDGTHLPCRKLLVATGVRDRIPSVPGMQEFFGSGVFHCPYCDGWEVRDQPLAVYGRGRNAAGLALSLKTWSNDVLLVSNGPAGLKPPEADSLARRSIAVRPERVVRLEGRGGRLERIVFAGAGTVPCRAIFFSTGQDQSCGLAATLGCQFTSKGTVRTNRLEGTNIPGLFVAGDASKDVQLAIVAAAEGAKAAIAINKSLEEEL